MVLGGELKFGRHIFRQSHLIWFQYLNLFIRILPESKVFISPQCDTSSTDLDIIQAIFNQVENKNTDEDEVTQSEFNISLQTVRKQLIEIENDKRTTLMIRNIPINYTKKRLQTEIDFKFSSKYDYLNIPFDLNGGFAFINLKNKKYLSEFFAAFHDRPWNYNKSKHCQLKYAKVQNSKQQLKSKTINPGIYNKQSISKIVENQKKQLTI